MKISYMFDKNHDEEKPMAKGKDNAHDGS